MMKASLQNIYNNRLIVSFFVFKGQVGSISVISPTRTGWFTKRIQRIVFVKSSHWAVFQLCAWRKQVYRIYKTYWLFCLLNVIMGSTSATFRTKTSWQNIYNNMLIVCAKRHSSISGIVMTKTSYFSGLSIFKCPLCVFSNGFYWTYATTYWLFIVKRQSEPYFSYSHDWNKFT